MPMGTFNPQVGATTQSRIGQGMGQSQKVQAAATSGTALKLAKYREAKSQYEKQLATQKEQFDTRMGMEREQFAQTQSMRRKVQKQTEKSEAKATRIARIGTSVTIGKMGMDLANEYDIDLAENMGFGGGEDVSGPGNVQADQMAVPSADTRSLGMPESETSMHPGDTGEASPRQTPQASSGGGDGGGSWWSQYGSQAMGAGVGGVTGGLMGSSMSMALFGEGKTQSTAGGAVGGAAGGYAGSGSVYGGVAGGVIGGVLGYLMG